MINPPLLRQTDEPARLSLSANKAGFLSLHCSKVWDAALAFDQVNEKISEIRCSPMQNGFLSGCGFPGNSTRGEGKLARPKKISFAGTILPRFGVLLELAPSSL
jgi:hypothetical protein